jgi:SspJ family small acid-soluble spore protein
MLKGQLQEYGQIWQHKDKDLVNGAFEDIEQVLKKHQKWCIIQKKDNK